jgi:hypothetical protein
MLMSGMLGGFAGGFQAYSEGQTQKMIYDYNAKVAEERAAYEEKQARTELKGLMGRQRTLYAKAGVDISEWILEETAAKGEKEALNIRYRGASEARLLRWKGKMAEKAGEAKLYSGILSGLASGVESGSKMGWFDKKDGGNGSTYLTGINYAEGPSRAGGYGFSIGGGYGRY